MEHFNKGLCCHSDFIYVITSFYKLRSNKTLTYWYFNLVWLLLIQKNICDYVFLCNFSRCCKLGLPQAEDLLYMLSTLGCILIFGLNNGISWSWNRSTITYMTLISFISLRTAWFIICTALACEVPKSTERSDKPWGLLDTDLFLLEQHC